MNHEFVEFPVERLETKLNEIEETCSGEEVERVTEEAKQYLEKLKQQTVKGGD